MPILRHFGVMSSRAAATQGHAVARTDTSARGQGEAQRGAVFSGLGHQGGWHLLCQD